MLHMVLLLDQKGQCWSMALTTLILFFSFNLENSRLFSWARGHFLWNHLYCSNREEDSRVKLQLLTKLATYFLLGAETLLSMLSDIPF